MESSKVSKISRAYGKTINFQNCFGTVPYKWCELHRRLKYRPFKAYWILLVGVAVSLHQAFFVSQSIRLFHNRHSTDLITLIRTFFVTFAVIMFNHNFYTILKDPPFHAALVNDMLRVADSFYGGRVQVVRGNGRGLLGLIWMLQHVGFEILPALLIVPMLWKPHVPIFYTSLLDNPMEYGLIARIPIFLIQTYVTTIHFGMLVYNGITMAMCLFFIAVVLTNYWTNN